MSSLNIGLVGLGLIGGSIVRALKAKHPDYHITAYSRSQAPLLQAKELGYGTCWCGLYPIEKWVVKFQELLDVTSIPCGFIALGVPEEDPEARGYFDPERVKYIR